MQEVSPKMSWHKVCGWKKCTCSKKCGVAAAPQTQILLGISLAAGSIQRSSRGAAVESYYCPEVSGWLCGTAGESERMKVRVCVRESHWCVAALTAEQAGGGNVIHSASAPSERVTGRLTASRSPPVHSARTHLSSTTSSNWT